MYYQRLYHDKGDSYFHHNRPEMLDFVPQGVQTALDVGCGNGDFGALLKSKALCKVWGVEPNSLFAEQAKAKLDITINGLFDKNLEALAGQKFDAIFFNDVLEHLIEPAKTLNDCKTLLNNNGYIIASIPNIRWYPVILSLLRYKDFKYEPAGVMDKTHLRFFTRKSMVRLFEDAGYKVLRIEGINKDNSFKWFNALNFMLFNKLWDMKFPQFAVVAQYTGHAG